MRAKVPVIKTASETPTGRFNVGINQSEAVKRKLEKLMIKKGNIDWRIPRDEVVIEPSDEIRRIMESNSDVKGGR